MKSSEPSRPAGRLRAPASLAVVLATATLTAAPPTSADNLRFQHLGSQDGLSQTTVNTILQDRHGLMWFGTLEGLNRFDGYDFEIYQHDPTDTNSLSQDSVRTLVEGADGMIWIGTDLGGLNRFDPGTGEFVHFRHEPSDPTSLGHDRIRALAFDAHGQLWIGTDGGGLNRFDPATETFTRFASPSDASDDLSKVQVRALEVGADGRVWMATDGAGLGVLTPETGAFRFHRHELGEPSSLISDRVYALHRDTDGTLWVGTAQGGLHRYEAQKDSFTRIEGLGSAPVRAILEGEGDELLLGTDDGLRVWNRQTRRVDTYRHDPSDLYSLSNDRVTSIARDRGGVVWVGTFNGLNRWNPTSGTFALYRSVPDDPESLSVSYVTAFAESETGELWVGTLGGLNLFDRSNERFTRIRHDPDDPNSLGDDRVMALHVDSRGDVWVGTIGGGLDRRDPETGRFVHHRHDPEDPSSLSFDGVTSIFEDRYGTLWVGTYRGGLNRYDRKTRTFVRYRAEMSGANGLGSDRVVALYEDRRGTLWVGTDGGGLNRYDRARDTFVSYRNSPHDPRSLSSDHAWTITEGPNGDLWIGTQGGGLNRWALADRRADRAVFERYMKRDGLPSSTVYAALWDDDDTLWLSSNRGISAFDPASRTFRHYNASHGLQSDEFNFAAAMRSRDGRFFFGGVNGFNVFDPAEIRVNDHVPPVVLTGILKFNQPMHTGVPIPELEHLEIGHRDSVITFEFAALDYTAPERNRYRYILEGFDHQWTDLGARRRVTYTNLDPGDYTLRVQAANNDGFWNRDGLSLGIYAAPPPWATPWAYSIYALVAIGLFAVFWHDQQARRRRAAELERANRDLHLEIGERQRAEGELRKLSLAVEQSPASVIITDRKGRIEYANPSFVKVTGYALEDVKGRSLALLRSGYEAGEQTEDLWRCIEAGRPWRGEIHSRKKSGELFWEDASVSPIFGADGEISHLLVVNEDLTARKEYELRLLRQAHYDHLTGLPNRTLALDRLARAVVRNEAEDKLVAVMFLDLDNFKIVNDTLGHAAGDELLTISANRLQATLRGSDTVARLGGDEFLFIVGDLEKLVDVEIAARRILDCFAEPLSIQGREIFVTASLGITIAPSDSVEPQVLLRNADAAMYRAKEAGRDAYQFFTPAMNEHAVARLQLESNLRQALERRELHLEYQPLIDSTEGRVVGAEALLRWRNPNLGRVSPVDFIPIAEETGLIVAIGEWVIESACRTASNWSSFQNRPLRVAVNISARQLRPDARLIQAVESALDRSGLPPSLLELEVTEGALLDDHAEAATILGQLHALGIRLALDDFGTGYSSLRYLRQFPFDVLKIDRSFVQDLHGPEDKSPLLRAIVAMAGGLDLEVIGEGVETRGQLAALTALGCSRVQGFLFSRPLSSRDFGSLLARGGVIEPAPEPPVEPKETGFQPRLVIGGREI